MADALSRVVRGGEDLEVDDRMYDDDPLADVDDIYTVQHQEDDIYTVPVDSNYVYSVEVSDRTKVLSECISLEEWILATRTDYDITLVQSFVRSKTLPLKTEHSLPAMVNQLLNRFALLSCCCSLIAPGPHRCCSPYNCNSTRRSNGNLQQVKVKMFLPRNV